MFNSQRATRLPLIPLYLIVTISKTIVNIITTNGYNNIQWDPMVI